ncbi:MAG: alanine:cation symporter family protein, partial [Fidelibacterota bacterium]
MLLGSGLIITIRLKLVQFWGLPHGLALITGKYDDPGDPGEITHFQALSAALSATLGTGNIAGVATAIHMGGPGALFWMWITAIVNAPLKYAGILLSHKYRTLHPDGEASGGP